VTNAVSGQAPESRATFRADIQGMRALAVSVVVLAHAGLVIFDGGFVGVDVFFVISGFLITSLLWREAEDRGRISLVGFYARRARRILPAATVVTVVTLVAAVVLLPLVRAIEILKDGLFAALFVANFRFAAVGTDYFAKGESPSPLQHFWSLSVEEQYYVVWPLLLIGLLALAAWRGRRLSRGLVLGVLGGVLVVSLAWSVWQTHSNPTVAYFSSLTRAWELAAGSLAAVALAGRRLALPRWLMEAGAWLGLAMIAVAVLGYDPAPPPCSRSSAPCCWSSPAPATSRPRWPGCSRSAPRSGWGTGPTRSTCGTGRCCGSPTTGSRATSARSGWCSWSRWCWCSAGRRTASSRRRSAAAC
jgi:peptidoglycan/LPS O-acetylase OafA/YrhL